MKKIYQTPKMEGHVMDQVQPMCQSGVFSNGDIVSGVGYGGVDSEGGKTPSAKEFNDFCEELDRMDW